MKKLLFSLLLLCTHVSGQEYRQVYNNDSLNVSSVVYIDKCPVNASIYEDKTSDNIYFTLKQDSYMLYVPELCLQFNVSCKRTCNINYHFLWLINQMKERKKDKQQTVIVHTNDPSDRQGD